MVDGRIYISIIWSHHASVNDYSSQEPSYTVLRQYAHVPLGCKAYVIFNSSIFIGGKCFLLTSGTELIFYLSSSSELWLALTVIAYFTVEVRGWGRQFAFLFYSILAWSGANFQFANGRYKTNTRSGWNEWIESKASFAMMLKKILASIGGMRKMTDKLNCAYSLCLDGGEWRCVVAKWLFLFD